MNKKNYDGIIFDSTVFLSEENYRKFPLYMRLLQVFAIYIGGYCFMTIFIKCFELQVINTHLLSAIIISGTVFYILVLFPRYNIVKLISVLAIYGGMLYYWFEQLRNGFFLLENAIIKRASAYYGFVEFRFMADHTGAAKDLTLLLIMIITPVVGAVSLSLVRGRCKIMCYIIMSIPVVVSFTMGITPPEVDLITYILVLLFISISNGFSHHNSSLHNSAGMIQKSMIYRISIRSAMVFCVIALVLIWGIKQFVPVKRYDDYKVIPEAKTKIQSFMTEFSISDIPDKLADLRWNIRPNRVQISGGLSLGELGRVDEVIYDDTEHLKITAPLKSAIEGIYLKGYIGSVYTRDSWDTHSRSIRKKYEEIMAKIPKEDFEPAIGSTLFLNQYPYRQLANQGRIGITYLKANNTYAYAPYFTTFKERDGVSFEYDLGAIYDKDIREGNYDYIYNISNLSELLSNNLLMYLSSDLDYETIYNSGYVINAEELSLMNSEHEKIYRQFVYDTYTQLPENGLDRLKSDFSREQVGTASENLQDAIAYVKDYLNRFTRYTLAPGRLPKNKDFVEYFLYENKIGYCAHFASAGALLLRAMGYPARYVEGYAINGSDIMETASLYITETEREGSTVEITVKDYNAHAWVEVYYDGFGWIPVEFTTGSGMEDLADTIGGDTTQGAIDEEPEDTPTEAAPSPTMLPEEDPKPSPPATGEDEDIKGNGALKEENGDKTGFSWYLAIVSVILIAAGIIGYILYIKKKREVISRENYSSQALELYKKIEGLFIIGDFLPNKSKSLEENEEYIKEQVEFIPIKEFEGCMEAVKKARFGKDTITPMEYMLVERFYRTIWSRIYDGLPLVKKMILKLSLKLDLG